MNGKLYLCCSCAEPTKDARACFLKQNPTLDMHDPRVCTCECHHLEEDPDLADAARLQRDIDEALLVSEGASTLRDLTAGFLEGARLKDENARLRAALEMLAQTRSVSGSAQGHFRTQRAILDAVLLGADVRKLEEVEAIVAGTWRPKTPA